MRNTKKITKLIITVSAMMTLIAPSFSVMATEPGNTAVQITSSPANQSVEEGASATFSAKASDSSCTYEWSTSIPIKAIEDNGWGKVTISGDGASLTIDNCKQELDGMVVFCLADKSAVSGKAALSVSAKEEVAQTVSVAAVNSIELSCTDSNKKYVKKPTDIFASGDTANKVTVKPEGITTEGKIALNIFPNKGYEISSNFNAGNIALNIANFNVESASVDGNGLLRVVLAPKINETYTQDDRYQLLFFNDVLVFNKNTAYGYNFKINDVTGAEETCTITEGSLPSGLEIKQFEFFGVHGTPTEDGIYEIMVKLTTPENGEVKAQKAEAAITVIVASDHFHSYSVSTTDSGNKRFKCDCGDSFEIQQTETSESAHVHKLSGNALDTSEEGFVKINKTCTDCGQVVEVKFAEPEHKDLDGDLHCDYCNKEVQPPTAEVIQEEEVVEEVVTPEEPSEEKPAPTQKPATNNNNNKKPAEKKTGSPIPIILLIMVVAGVGGFMFYKKKHKVVHYTPEMMEEERREKESRSPYAAPRPAEVVEPKEPEPEPGSAVVVESSPVPLEMEDLPKEEKKPVSQGPLPTPDKIVVQTPRDSQK